MKQTDFLKMYAPELDDEADITKLSANMNTIDDAVETLTASKASLTQRVTALETHDTVVDGQITVINGNVSSLSGTVASNNTTLSSRITTLETKHNSDVSSLTTAINAKSNKTYVDTELAKKVNTNVMDAALITKADKSYVDTQDALKANKSYVDTELAKKATTTALETGLAAKADKTYVDAMDAYKANTTYVDSEVAKKADKTYVDTQLSTKATTDALTSGLSSKTDKTYVDTELAKKANNSDITTVDGKISACQNSVNTLSTTTAQSISAVNTRIDNIIPNLEPTEIESLTATPSLCALGETENILLSWNVSGNIANKKINGADVTGNSKTISGVTSTTTYTLTVTDGIGDTKSKSVAVKFGNHVYYGVNNSDTASTAMIKGLSGDVVSDKIERTINVSVDNKYIYYAYPKRLGTAQFASGGIVGGFGNPATLTITSANGYAEEYYIYRSTNKLTGTIKIDVKDA